MGRGAEPSTHGCVRSNGRRATCAGVEAQNALFLPNKTHSSALKEKLGWPFSALEPVAREALYSMRKNHRNKVVNKLREVAGIEPESDVWVVADEPRYDHMATVARDARTFLGALTANVDWLRSGLRD